ncbi:MAG: hypothetical protein A2X11_11530 [Bacteroidetes bacterium GWE2_42_24]|nr:MAG: hypothetical protein A2X11_11530 [Bacteroidetes bacterium GWE2_42_24]OFY26681.1 MAG: hypothetical protein A2X09_13495 [Bacteroidetes bacterium GWF2_43_11]
MSYSRADIRIEQPTIQELPKHCSVKTTMVYTHIIRIAIRTIAIPLDRIVNQQNNNSDYH